MCTLAQMVDVIKWCFELGVEHVSVYAFSIDNFRRDADEVAGLMALAADKFEALMQVGARVRAVCRALIPAGSSHSLLGCAWTAG